MSAGIAPGKPVSARAARRALTKRRATSDGASAAAVSGRISVTRTASRGGREASFRAWSGAKPGSRWPDIGRLGNRCQFARRDLPADHDTGYLRPAQKCVRTVEPNAPKPMPMPRPLSLHEDRLFPADPVVRGVARRLYDQVAGLPIISPHGHTDPEWFATDAPFADATSLLLAPDHYLYRMLYSAGVPLEALGVPARKGASPADPRAAWRLFASHQHLFRGTPSALWLNHVYREVFGFDVALEASTADLYFDRIGELLATPGFRPRALFDRFNIEVLATTESPSDDLTHHR